MTASKSSRARNARAQRPQGVQGAQGVQANAARNGGAGGRAHGSGTAVKSGAVAKAGSQARTVATRGGVPDRRGSRGPAAAELAAEAPTSTTVPLWMQLVTFFFALAGLGVSIYLTIAHFTESKLLGCSESGLVNCTKVTTSPQSYVFGIPVAVLGLAFFVAAVALMSPWAWRSARREIYLLRIASLIVGIGFVLYLIYAELFIIGSICLYCTSVHAITFVLFVLTIVAAAAWGLPPARRRS
jgi:uncharacterized membrane protein